MSTKELIISIELFLPTITRAGPISECVGGVSYAAAQLVRPRN